ncbi:hypothetical protein I316_04533 [Kwoniella heveanensis BCC8398]|uniref:Palmitoyltransferase n=1 Tax=Kwoniella heveanensis BCC8398 TaxID=1296120 RepID=A0A1B9GS02_9TREE|nr:hypothetical protein I316_04533 [Kwoniella heveanensis BCC8398]
MARTSRPWWKPGGPDTPDWWVSRKAAILIVIGLLCWSFYVIVGRVCTPMFRGNSDYKLGRAAGAGILVGYVTLWLLASWTYLKMILTGPGFAKKVVPQSDKPDTSAYPPYPPPPQHSAEYNSDDTQEPDPSELAPVANLIGSALYNPDGPSINNHHAGPQSDHGAPVTDQGKKKIRDWQAIPRPVPAVDVHPRWCRFCEIVKPDRTHHCRHCGTCVLQFDHHCLWIGQCVGWANHKFFIIFTFWGTLFCFYLLITLIAISAKSSYTDGQVVGLIAVAALFGLFTFAMNTTHVHLILCAQTTVESFSARDQREAEDRVLQEEYGYFFHNLERRKVRKRWNEEWGGSSLGDRWVSGTRRQLWEQEMGESVLGWFSVMVNLFEGLPSLAAPPPPLSESNYGLTAEEVQAAFGTEALNSLTRGLSGSECHSGITRRIQLSCGRTNSAEVSAMTEQDKKGLAISLTLCSMESALQPIPTECLRWSPHEASPTEHRPTRQDWFKEQAPREEQQQQALCLSAQDWSSYNVYLSDAKPAQTRYFNATQEKLAFISLLKKREEKETERHGAEVASLKRRLTVGPITSRESPESYTSLQDLHKLSELVYDSMRAVKSDIELNKQLSEDVQTAFSSFELARGTEWDRVETAIQEKLLRLTDHFQGISDDFQATWIPKMSARLETVLTSHEMALVDRNEETGRVMQNWMRHVEDQVNTFAVSTSNDMYLANLGGGFQRLEMALGSSLNATAHLTVAQAEMAEIIQVTTRKTELLFGSQERLESSINRTIDALNPRGVRSAWSWIQPVSVMSAVGAGLCIDSIPATT